MKIIALLVLGALCLWLQPWSDATATPHPVRFTGSRATESAGRCGQGSHKHSITGRCVRNQFRLPSWSW